MRIVIVTGMSGAGKSTVLKSLEDLGYFCVDNLPVPLVRKFVEMTRDDDFSYDKIALGIDIRSGEALGELGGVLKGLRSVKSDDEKAEDGNGINYEILYLDASNKVLIKRYT